jgi:hypothetical protein
MDEAGATAAAAAMATVVFVTALGLKVVHVMVADVAFRRLQAWRKR